MKPVGIVICNYNKREFVVNCVKSVLEQSFSDFDIIVVDNASTDDSVIKLRETYGDKIKIIENKENLGGAGGFNAGLNYCRNLNYKYIVLLDNDIILDKTTIEKFYDFMNSNSDVGIVGAKVMVMDKPDMVQDFGNKLDFEKYKEVCGYQMVMDNDKFPEVNGCDYVPTCAVMVRNDALPKDDFNCMPVDNFIYFDDIELCYKISKNGYKVCAINAKVWHKGGFNAAKNTFVRYYFTRNRLNFFAKYVNENKVEDFITKALSELFAMVYGFNYKKQFPQLASTIYAVDDFLHEVHGKAEEYKILSIPQDALFPFEELIKKYSKILIKIDEKYFNKIEEKYMELIYLTGRIRHVNSEIKIIYCTKNFDSNVYNDCTKKVINKENINFDVVFMQNEPNLTDFDAKIQLCEHVSKVTDNILPTIYLDKYLNCISNESELLYFKNYECSKEMFMNTYKNLFIEQIKKIRQKNNV